MWWRFNKYINEGKIFEKIENEKKYGFKFSNDKIFDEEKCFVLV